MKITRRQLRQIIQESLLHEKRMAPEVLKIVSRAIAKGPMTHQELLAHVLDEFPNTSDEEIDMHIDDLEASGDIIYDKNLQKYK